MCFVPEGSSSKQCNQTGHCGNSSPLNWCAGNPDVGGCYGGSVGGRGILQMSAKEIESSHDLFWGTHDKSGNLILKGVGLLRQAGCEIGDTLTGVYIVGDAVELQMSQPKDRYKILTWELKRPLVNILFEREGVQHTRTMRNPVAKD